MRQEYRIFCFACVDSFALIHYVQLQFAVHLTRLLHTAIDNEAAWNPSWKRAFTGERTVSSGSWIKFNFFATRISENQSDCFFSMLEHATVPVRATKFAEVETGLNRAMISINVSNFFTCFQKIGPSTWTQRSKFGRLIPHFGRTLLTTRVGRYFELCNGMMW